MRGLAALLVLGTHAAFATGKLSHGYVGAIYARLEVGVAIFFVLGDLAERPRAGAGEIAPHHPAEQPLMGTELTVDNAMFTSVAAVTYRDHLSANAFQNVS
jgi:hypothetical protein